MTDSALPWQQATWASLWQRHHDQRMPHALLLRGAPGVGKLAFAQRLAASLFCDQPDAHGVACGNCRGCHLYAAGSHPDWVELQPEEVGRSIKIEQVRHLGEELALTPQYGGYKVAVIRPADALTQQAANGLLKTLEEPASGTLIVLVTARASALPATIRSRCQSLQLLAPPRDQGLAWLGQRWPLERAEVALDLASGAPLLADTLLAEEGGLEAAQHWSAQWCELLARRVDPALLAEQWAVVGLRPALQWLLATTAEMLRLDLGGDAEALRKPSQSSGLQTALQGIDSRKLLIFREQLEQLHALDIQGLNAQSVLEGLLLEAGRLSAVSRRR